VTKRYVLFLLVLIALFSLSFSAPASAANAEDQWLVGAAAFSITPLAEHFSDKLYMGGYGFGKERGPALGVRDEIWARAMALSDGTAVVVWVMLDLPGISCSDLKDIRLRAAERAGIHWENIWVSVTHTHAGPDLQGLWGGVPYPYREYLRNQAVEAVTGAVQDMRPGQLRYARVDYAAGNRNRRGSGLTDPALQVLHAVTTAGDPIAAMLIYGIHTTFLGSDNSLVSADIAGAVVAALEENLGGQAIFAAGIQGDQTLHRGDFDMQGYGSALAGAALQALSENPVELPFASLDLRSRQLDLAVKNPVFVLGALLGTLREYGVRFSLARGLFITTEVSFLRLGDELSIITVPGEALVRLGLELKEISNTSDTIVLGLTNGTLGYLVHEDDWRGGIPFLNRGYEESVSLGKHAGTAVRENLRLLIKGD
jgi:hypothetical protein